MKLITIILGLTFSVNAMSQKMYETEGTICPLKFMLEDNDLFIGYQPNDSVLVADFLNGIDPKQVEKLKGVFMFQIMIDSASHVCCVSYTNKSTISDKKLDIVNRVVSLPGWHRAAPGFERDNICALYSIYINTADITVQRTGYNRNKGKHLLESKVYQRYKTIQPDSVAQPVVIDSLAAPKP